MGEEVSRMKLGLQCLQWARYNATRAPGEVGYGNASTIAEEAAKIFRSVGSKKGILLSLHQASKYASLAGDFERSEAFGILARIESSVDIAKENEAVISITENSRVSTQVAMLKFINESLKRGDEAVIKGDNLTAIKEYVAAADAAKSYGFEGETEHSTRRLFSTCMMNGFSAASLGRTQDAANGFFLAAAFADEYGMPGEAKMARTRALEITLEKANMEMGAGRPANAVAWTIKARGIAVEAGMDERVGEIDRRSLTMCMRGGNSAYELGDSDTALTVYKMGQKLAMEYGHFKIAEMFDSAIAKVTQSH